MLGLWEYIEADFMRDYGIDLVASLRTISWRRYRALLNGLNPFGAYATNYQSKAKKLQEDDPETAKQAAESFWSRVTTMAGPSRDN